MSKNIFDRFECERLDDQYSFYQCIKEQKDGRRIECRNCPEGQEHMDYFRRQHAAMKAKSEEAKEDMKTMKKKVCPKCQKEAGSNVQRTCECGHEFFTKQKIGGGKTVVAKKKEPKAQEEKKIESTTLGQPIHQNCFELTIVATDKVHALKILEVAMGYGADFGGWRVVA